MPDCRAVDKGWKAGWSYQDARCRGSGITQMAMSTKIPLLFHNIAMENPRRSQSSTTMRRDDFRITDVRAPFDSGSNGKYRMGPPGLGQVLPAEPRPSSEWHEPFLPVPDP